MRHQAHRGDPGPAPSPGDLDLLFYDGPLDGDVKHLELLRDPYVLYVLVARPGTFPEGTVGTEQLGGASLVTYPLVCDQPRMEKALACNGPNPRIVFRSGGDDTLLAMIRAGMGAAVLASLVVHAADERGDGDLRVHELRPAPPPWEIGVIWSAGRTHSPLSARATEIAVETAQELERTI